ncbi:hypothetical protein CC78DRAFT_533933 [Lojkania enalia]|uniref:Uncharacterized protein n=1 Tax=Lojkania enalia TaxID=147567 RepID=A0A9P4KCF5_9PLEO|nr:hypothetical protein CC78DRAFT_533933 [Didymosphaeria enalia]
MCRHKLILLLCYHVILLLALAPALNTYFTTKSIAKRELPAYTKAVAPPPVVEDAVTDYNDTDCGSKECPCASSGTTVKRQYPFSDSESTDADEWDFYLPPEDEQEEDMTYDFPEAIGEDLEEIQESEPPDLFERSFVFWFISYWPLLSTPMLMAFVAWIVCSMASYLWLQIANEERVAFKKTIEQELEGMDEDKKPKKDEAINQMNYIFPPKEKAGENMERVGRSRRRR